MTKVTRFKKGDRVKANGYEGVVLGYYAERIIEVRLASGVIATGDNEIDVQLIERAKYNV